MALLSENEIVCVFERFKKQNPEPKSELEYKNPYTLLVAVVLSAQATDKSVNKATRSLFEVADTPEKMTALGEEKLIEYIRSIGLYKNKAHNVIELSKTLISEFNSQVPSTREELERLSGVGRKTANLVLTKGHNIAGICVDIHVHRISNRLGLTKTKTPDETELALRKILPKKYWIDFNTYLVTLGQNVCKPQKPDCSRCPIEKYCLKMLG